MISGLRFQGGRGYAVAVFAIGLGTIVEMTCTLALFDKLLPAAHFAAITTSYFLMLGAVGAVFQGRNIARALPGQRYQETDERVSDAES